MIFADAFYGSKPDILLLFSTFSGFFGVNYIFRSIFSSFVRLPFMAGILRKGTVLSFYSKDLVREVRRMNKECQHHLFEISNRLELIPLLDGDFSESAAEARPVCWRLLTGDSWEIRTQPISCLRGRRRNQFVL